MKRGKKYVEAAKAIDRGTLYDVADAVSLVKKTAVDVYKRQRRLRISVVFPIPLAPVSAIFCPRSTDRFSGLDKGTS